MGASINSIQYFHGGDLGDTIYSIPALRRLSYPAHLTLYPMGAPARVVLNQLVAANLLPLLNTQQGLAADWQPTYSSDGLRLDFGIRRFYNSNFNLADMYSNWVGHDHWPREQPWLVSDKEDWRSFRIVVARSTRYRNSRFPWKIVYELIRGRACFLGTVAEHADFENKVGEIEYISTPTLLEAARLIAASDVCIMNQSCPLAIAHALCRPVIVEQAYPANCHFSRTGAWYPDDESNLPALDNDFLFEQWRNAASRRADGKSVHSPALLGKLAGLCRQVRRISGHVADVGVCRGGVAAVLSWALTRKVHILRSSIELGSLLSDTPEFDDVSFALQDLKRFVRVYPTEFHFGPFPAATLPADRNYAFVHIDMSTYDATCDAIEWFRGRILSGGIIAFGGYGHAGLAGVRKAIADSGLQVQIDGELAWHLMP